MKFIQTPSYQRIVSISHEEWSKIGRMAGWLPVNAPFRKNLNEVVLEVYRGADEESAQEMMDAVLDDFNSGVINSEQMKSAMSSLMQPNAKVVKKSVQTQKYKLSKKDWQDIGERHGW